ncbi:coiled-coil domain-containing protein 122-like isoform X2 [Liolophura sinensis]
MASSQNASNLTTTLLQISPYRTQQSSGGQKLSLCNSSLDMESEMVDQALDSVASLPDAVSEAVLMHKDQSTEIQRQHVILDTLRGKFKEAQKRREATLEDIAHVTRQIYLTEDRVLEKKRLCEAHETKLNYLLSKVEELKSRLVREMQEKKLTQEKFQEYRKKMVVHRELTHKYEEEFPVQKKLREMKLEVTELRNLREGITSNKAETERITSGAAVQDLHQQQQNLEQECQQVEKRIAELKSEIAEQQAKETQITQNTEVLHKRNAAQLTRLKRQLKEVQSHNRQWQEKAAQLRQLVSQVRRHLEE